MNNIFKEKAHASGMGLSQYLADLSPATLADVAGHDTLEKLLFNGSLNSVIYLDKDISIFTGALSGEKQLDTADTIGLVMLNNRAEQVNIASIPLDDNGRIFISDTDVPSAFVMGSMSKDSKWIVISDLAEAVRCYNAYRKLGIDVTVLTCLVPSLFNRTIKHFAEVKQVTIIATSQYKAKVITPLKGVNVEAIICEHTLIYDAIEFGAAYDDLIADTEIINLQALGKPKPKPISQTLPPVKTVTDDMMPSTLWLYCDNNAKRLSTPIEYIAVPLVVAFSSVIGVKVGIYPKHYDDWDVVPNLWGAIIGNPSTKKSPAIDSGLKPLNNLVHNAKVDYVQAQKDFATQKEVNKHKNSALEGELKTLAKKQAKQTDDDENRITDDELIAKAKSIAEANKADENAPTLKRYITNDSTYQQLGVTLSQTNNGLLIARDELTGLLASLDGQQNNEARNFYLEAFNGTGSHIMERVGRGLTFIETHCLSVIGGIQPNKLERYLEKTIKGLDNDGLMQRFQLAVYPDHIKGAKEQDIAPNKEIRQAIYDLFEIIDNMSIGDFIKYGANPPDDFNKRPYYYFNDEAYRTFMQWYDHNKAKADECEHSVIAEHMMKYPKTIPSLALIFHLVDCIEHQANLGRIGMKALNAALKWHSMLETHMMRIYSLVTDSASIKAAYLSEKLLNMAKNSTDKTDKTDWISHGFTARDLHRRNWKGLNDTDDVLNALEVLVGHDWLSWESVESTGQGGRPTERYYINPRISELI
jgi:hypothetical protein